MREVLAHVRAYAIPRQPERDPGPDAPPRFVPKPRWTPRRFGARVLTFDTETTLDASQRLLVGAYRLYEWSDRDGAYRLLEEGLVRGDGLPPAEASLLRRYAASRDLPLLSREDFAVLLTVEGHDLGTLLVGFNLRFDLGALALPRVRCHRRTKRAKVRYRPGWGQGRGRWRRGFRLVLLDTYTRPRLRLRGAGPGSTFVEWSSYSIADDQGTIKGRRPFRGRFLDLREAVHALAGETTSLEGACARMGVLYRKRAVEYGHITRALLSYLIEDVGATWALFLAVRDEWNRHPFTPVPSPALPSRARASDTPDLAKDAMLLTRMKSPASLAKGYLGAMGIRPRLEVQPDFPPEALGQAMVAFYGGRIEVRADLQGMILPVVALDVMSTYLSVNALLDLHRWDSAAHLQVEDATEDARALLSRLSFDDLFRPEVWPGLAVFCEVEVHGDLLPIRYPDAPGDAPTCHVKRLHPGTPGLTLWYALPDLLYAKEITGQTPTIRRAWRIIPEGTLSGLRPVRFRGEVLLDPRTDYLRAFRDARLRDVQPRLEAARRAERAQEAEALNRLQRAMKAVGEPLGYGAFVEVDEKDLLPAEIFERGEARADVWGGAGRFEARITREEYAGRWFFSPRGAIVTAGARLLLGMMERRLTEAGGGIVSMNTDSVLVVATPSGEEICLPRRPGGRGPARVVRALSYAEVECIRESFIALSGVPGVSLWKRERVNDPHPDSARDPALYALPYGPGRYALFNRTDTGSVLLRDRKETALGHLIPPSGFTRDVAITAVWEALVREKLGERDAVNALPFAREPALGRLPLTTPDLLRRVRTQPRGSRKVKGHCTPPATPRPYGFLTVAYPMTNLAIFEHAAYWSGWCLLKKRESVGCPAPHEACPHRPTCPLAYPIRPATYDVPGPDVLRKGRWFDTRTGRPLPFLHALPADGRPETGLRVRTWAEYVRHTLARGPRWWEDDGPEVRVVGLVHTGKESRHLEDIAASLRIPGDEVLYYRPEPADPDDAGLRAFCRRISMRFLCGQTRLDRRTVQRFRNGHARHLHDPHRRLLWQSVSAWIALHPEVGTVMPAGVPMAQEAAGG